MNYGTDAYKLLLAFCNILFIAGMARGCFDNPPWSDQQRVTLFLMVLLALAVFNLVMWRSIERRQRLEEQEDDLY